MIALTQEKREELANYARARLASHVVHGGCSDEEDIFKIALASLTAEPDCWSIVDRVFSTKEEALTPGFIGEPEPLFACPPVPKIKFPEIVSRSEIAGDEAARDWFLRGCEWYEKAFKRLNGLGE